ncbi:N-acetylornithine deacetylase (EC [Olavius sp. associated proteobacterium Delta 1]|nr:N-acetylornithine deacetylase (EC [Olavius sp. associated proteobacterium Delta 1]
MIKLIKAIQKDVIEFTQEIIKIPSFTGEEGKLANVILRKLKEFDVDDAFIDGIGNVVGVIHGQEKGINILLNGHLDVVPAGNIDSWSPYDPFGGVIDESGNIHGRGAADLKGGLAVHLFVMKLLKLAIEQGSSFKGDLIFSAVVHEEAAEMFGMDYLCQKTLPIKKLGCDLVFLCEPTGLGVVLGQRGKVELVVKTKGKTAHSSIPKDGINALEKMMPVLDYIFNEMTGKLSNHPILGDSSITVTDLICKPGTLSIIPDECEISIDRRYMPEESLTELLAEFEHLFEEIKKEDPQFEATVSVRKIVEKSYTGYKKEVQKYHPPWITNQDHPLVQKILLALKKTGQQPDIKYWKFGTDGSMTAGLLGIPTIGYSGTEERYAHTSDERVDIAMMMQSLEGYFSIISELMELENRDS